ncbi:MAG TPA: hypothetical protein VIY72_12850 [Acidimicrobiales bacterium]
MDDGLKVGTVALGMAGPLAIGPEKVVFTADSRAAKVYAVEVEAPDRGAAVEGPLDVDDLDVRIGAYLGCDVDDLVIRDLAVQPGSGDVLLSVQRGQGDAGTAVLLRLRRDDAAIEEVPLTGVRMAEWSLDDAPAVDDERTEMSIGIDEGDEVTYGDLTFRLLTVPIRTSTVTDLGYLDGTLLVAGLSNEEFASKLRRIPFPFGPDGDDSSLEIFHVSHGAWETAAPIRTFVPYEDGRSILASYTCTPVVHFPLADIGTGDKAVGRTVAELGAVNTPLDMTTFRDADGEHLLVANTSHGLLKIDCADIDGQTPLTEPQGPRGVPRETSDLQGVVRLANLDDRHVLVLQRDDDGRRRLRTVKTESL